MKYKRRIASSLVQRPSKPRGRSGLPGYPSLFLGSGLATKMLVEIAVAEPVALRHLPMFGERSNTGSKGILRRLVGQGLVRRFKDPRSIDHAVLTLDRRHLAYSEVHTTLQAIGRINGIEVPAVGRPLGPLIERPETITYETSAAPRIGGQHRIPFGNIGLPIQTIFGHPHRTKAILLIGAASGLDQMTVGRHVGISGLFGMANLLQLLECDDIVQCELTGQFNVYSLVEWPWTDALRDLIKTILASDETLSGLAAAAGISSRTGRWRDRPRKPGILRDRNVLARGNA